MLEDSMIKHLNGWEMLKKVQNPDCKIYVKHFAGAKTTCIKDYTKCSLLKNVSNHFVLHIGTNDLDSDRTATSIASTTIHHATSMKND